MADVLPWRAARHQRKRDFGSAECALRQGDREGESTVFNRKKINLSNLKVAHRLGIGFFLVSALLVIVGMFSVHRMSQLEVTLSEITDVNSVEASVATAVDETISTRALVLRNLILFQPDQQDQIQIESKRFDDETAAYERSVRQLDALFKQPGTIEEKKTLLEEIRQLGEQASPLMQMTRQLAAGGAERRCVLSAAQRAKSYSGQVAGGCAQPAST
ncbi:MCP four helix bundle domain-containing protein [Trinickia sp. EG282A]|uniref:MCP four helix bundle domain-containing protein n=1 Tax=Trinickia sp. EG282A TaxID=3237013 RepID=UPI0034D22D64